MIYENSDQIFHAIVSITFIIPCGFIPLIYLLKILRDFLQINMNNLPQKEVSYRQTKERYENKNDALSDELLMNIRINDGLFISDMTEEHRKEYADKTMSYNKKIILIMLIPITACIILMFINIWLTLFYCILLFIGQLIAFFMSRSHDVKLKLYIIENYPELEHLQNSHFYIYQKQLRK